MSNFYYEALVKRVRFATPTGVYTTEDFLAKKQTTAELTAMAKDIAGKLKESKTDSVSDELDFLKEADKKEDPILRIQFEIVKAKLVGQMEREDKAKKVAAAKIRREELIREKARRDAEKITKADDTTLEKELAELENIIEG